MPMKLSIAALASGLAGTMSLTAAAGAGPAVATEWKPSTLGLKECQKRGAEVMREAGFGRIEFTGQSVFGTRGDYTAAVRCLTGKAIVLFIVSGPGRRESGG
jgi:hypothetical protein